MTDSKPLFSISSSEPPPEALRSIAAFVEWRRGEDQRLIGVALQAAVDHATQLMLIEAGRIERLLATPVSGPEH